MFGLQLQEIQHAPTLRAKAALIPECSFPTIAEKSQALKPFYKLVDLIGRAEKQHPMHHFFSEGIAADVCSSKHVWCFKTIKIDTQFADRKRSMFEGPFFTSEKYPWPSGREAKYAAPLMQIDLCELSILNEKDYGDGLLQVFELGQGELDLRVVPRIELETAHLTACPSPTEDNFLNEDHRVWLDPSGEVSQIIGYEPPRLSELPYFEADENDPVVFQKITEQMQSVVANHCEDIFVVRDLKTALWRQLLINIGCCECYDWEGGNPQVSFCDDPGSDNRFSANWGSRRWLY